MLQLSAAAAAIPYAQLFRSPSLAGTYGTFTFNPTTGAWTYTLDRKSTRLPSSSLRIPYALSVKTKDGTQTHDIVVHITGANENAALSLVPGGKYALLKEGAA